MDKVKGIMIIVVAIFSVVITVVVANILLDTTGKVNQGNFRISDLTIESTATLTEVQGADVQITKLSDLVFNVTQTNSIAILIESNVEASEIAIENFTINKPSLCGKMTICQKDNTVYELTEEFCNMPLTVEKEDDNKYIINLNIDNENVITNRSVDESVEEIQYDAKIFDTFGIDVNTLMFDVSFDLCIKDETGKVARTTISLNMPTDETFVKGMSILRQDVSKFIFTVLN